MSLDFEKFSFAQMTSNADGKTSSTAMMGILICTIGTLCFLMGCFDKMFLNKDIDVITQSLIFVGIGAGLLGYRKSQEKHIKTLDIEASKIENNIDEVIEETIEDISETTK